MDEQNTPNSFQQLVNEIEQLRARLAILEQAARKLSPAEAVKPQTPPPPPPSREKPIELEAVAAGQAASPPPPPKPIAHTAQPPYISSPVVKAKKPAGGPTFEQKIGTKWLLICGVIVLLLSAVFFFKYAADQGWINPVTRVITGAIVGLVMIVIGEWALRRNMRLFAAGMMGTAVVLLYIVVFVASPRGLYDLVPTTYAFTLMCVVTLLGIGLSLRSDNLTTALISSIGAFATPILLSTGENQQVVLMSYLLAVNAGFLLVGLLKRWHVLGPVMLVGTVVLFAGWFDRFYDVSAMTLTLGFAWGFWTLFAAYIVSGISLKRTDAKLAGAIGVLANIIMLILVATTCGMADELHAFGIQLLILTGATFAFGLWQKWRLLLPFAAGVAGLALLTWIMEYMQPFTNQQSCYYAWGLLALVVAAILIGRDELWRRCEIATLAIASSIVVFQFILAADSLQPNALAGQLLGVNVVVLALCQLRRWHWIRTGLLVWTAVCLLRLFDIAEDQSLLVSTWIWICYALILADVFIRAWWKRLNTKEALDATLATLGTGAMFAASYALLKGDYQQWMGLYAAALGAAAIVVAVVVRKLADRRKLGYAFLGQGLVLITLAVPIQFDRSSVTIAWAVQAVVVMFLARRLGNIMLLMKSPIVLALALAHFALIALPDDPALKEIMFAPAGVEITYGLLLAIGLTAAFLAASAILRFGPAIKRDFDECTAACVMVCTGSLVFFVMTAIELPLLAASWWWAALAVLVAAVSLLRRSSWLAVVGLFMLSAVAVKWIFNDTLFCRLENGLDNKQMLIVNWQMGLGVLLAAAILAHLAIVKSKKLKIDSYFVGGFMLLGALLIVWGGSFEIDRYFATADVGSFVDSGQAMQMALSIWWALYAIALLIIGFAISRQSVRYLAIVLFAITLAKVFLIDMAGIERAYRILSTLVLSLLLLGASLLYHKRFKLQEAPKELDKQ